MIRNNRGEVFCPGHKRDKKPIALVVELPGGRVALRSMDGKFTTEPAWYWGDLREPMCKALCKHYKKPRYEHYGCYNSNPNTKGIR